MENILRNAVQQRRQILIDKLIKIGMFKKDDRHLYEWTLSDLEEEYKFIDIYDGYGQKSYCIYASFVS